MRTFQYSDAKSHKFWNIDISDSSFTVTFGKVGTAGQTQRKNYPTADKAQTEAEKLIREKMKKGYTETTPKATASVAEALEKALAADPHDLTAACAYADYLYEQGDPRGEFMQVQIALEDESRSKADRTALKKQEASLLKKHQRDWLGPLAAVTLDAEPVAYWQGSKQSQRAPVAHRFARGWLSRLEFHELTVAQARALAQTSQARFLRELVVEDIESEMPVGSTEQYIESYYEPGPDVPADIASYDTPGLHALCRCPHLATVRRFRLGELAEGGDGQEEEYFNCHTSGELAHHLVKQMPHLEELYLLAHRVDANKLFALPMPHLRVLQLYHSDSYPLDKLAANKSLTNLTTLLCHPHAWEDQEGAHIRLPHLRAICRSPHLTALTHLRLRLTDFGDAGAKEIVASGILKRLKVLDLQGGCITDEGVRLLAGCPDLKHLDYLNLGRNALTKEGEQAIKATGVKADLGAQHGEVLGEPGDGDIPEYLFEGDIEQPMSTPRYVLIANPGTKRCETYRRELLAFWSDRGVAPDVEVVPWADVVPRDGNLDLPAFDRPALVRLESPSKDQRVTRLLLEAGARHDPAEPSRDWQSLAIPKGMLLRPGLYYRGFRRVLHGLARAFAACPHLAPTACPLAIAEMFDKTATSAKLHAAEVPVPNWLANPRDVFAEVIDSEGGNGWPTIYLKLNTGSSATGIIVLRLEEGTLHGTTTLAEIDGQFFNSRRLLHLTGPTLERAVHFLLREGAIAQQGVPLAQIDGQNFDVRVVCVYGRPVASIFRLASGPMTNLQLGGRRGNFAACRAAVPTRDWLDALDHCADAAACFDSAIAGVDLVFERGFRRHFILEVNAFGDFFPGWTEAGGKSVHALEIAETLRQFG